MSTTSQTFWIYKRGFLVLKLSSSAGLFQTTTERDDAGVALVRNDAERCLFASGQFMSTEWEPRVRLLLDRANDLVELIELLEDRRYQVDVEPPSMKARPFRFL